MIDRPETKGGADHGPMGGELFLAAIGGCFTSTLHAAIKARNAPIARVHVQVVGCLAEDPPRYTAVNLRVSADCGDRTLLDKLVEIADRGCIMTNTLRGTTTFAVLVV